MCNVSDNVCIASLYIECVRMMVEEIVKLYYIAREVMRFLLLNFASLCME